MIIIIYIFIYIPIYIHLHLIFEYCSKCLESPFLNICSYIQKMTLNPVESVKTSIYNPKQIKTPKVHFHFLTFSKHSKIYIFQKGVNQANQRLMLTFMHC